MNKRKYKVEQIVITGKKEEKDAAYEYLFDNGYIVTSSGPIRVKKHRYDFSRFRLVGERPLECA